MTLASTSIVLLLIAEKTVLLVCAILCRVTVNTLSSSLIVIALAAWLDRVVVLIAKLLLSSAHHESAKCIVHAELFDHNVRLFILG